MTGAFTSPFDVPPPPGAEGWERLYPSHLLFSDDRRGREEAAFWFRDAMHWPRALEPWEATFVEYGLAALSQYNTRHYLVPSALGVDARIVNGHVYLSPLSIDDPAVIAARVPLFKERAGFYFDHWDELYDGWMAKTRALVGDLEAVRFDALPDREPLDVVTSGRGTGSGMALIGAYHELIDLALKLWNYHFELLNLGYAAYLDLFGFCKQAFPSVAELSIAKMVAGVQIDLFRPDEELRRLARAARELGVDSVIMARRDPGATLAELARTDAGRSWIERLDTAKQPWFHFSSGTGFYHSDPVWIDDLSIPFGLIADYAAQLAAGADIERPIDAICAERERIAAGYRDLLGSAADRAAFDAKLDLARTVFPYVENHNFYVEHWGHAVLWRKLRDLGRVLRDAGFLSTVDDVFLLRRNEIPDVLFDLYLSWAVGTPARGPHHWPRELHERRRIVAALRAATPPIALGTPPSRVTEPFTIMLWGITSDAVRGWLGAEEAGGADIRGVAASPGVAEGVARVIGGAHELGHVLHGEILVASVVAPSWAPIFSRVAATVTDIGGTMSHAAIVCREYGLPAVTGSGSATQTIKTGQRIRVDGSAGTVTILE